MNKEKEKMTKCRNIPYAFSREEREYLMSINKNKNIKESR